MCRGRFTLCLPSVKTVIFPKDFNVYQKKHVCVSKSNNDFKINIRYIIAFINCIAFARLLLLFYNVSKVHGVLGASGGNLERVIMIQLLNGMGRGVLARLPWLFIDYRIIAL